MHLLIYAFLPFHSGLTVLTSCNILFHIFLLTTANIYGNILISAEKYGIFVILFSGEYYFGGKENDSVDYESC